MPVIAPIQTSFAQGVISPRMRGNVGSKSYARGLARCDNWIPTPQGSLLRRNGSSVVAAAPAGDPFLRVLPFKSTNLERFQVVLSDLLLQVFTPAGAFAAFSSEYVVNGDCNLGGGGWAFVVREIYGGFGSDQYLRITNGAGAGDIVRQTVAAVPAATYTYSFRVRNNAGGLPVYAQVGTTLDGAELLAEQAITAEGTYNFSVIVGAGPASVYLRFRTASGAADVGVDDVSLRLTASKSVATPWSAADIANLQYVGETGRDRMVFVDGKHIPYVLSRLADGTWTFLDIATVGWTPDASWTGTNYPSAVDVWQGRLWFAATPAKKNTFWASKPGTYDFTIGDTAGDAFSYDVAMRGEIRWMQGQKVMLVGSDDGEYSISASDGVVYAGNIDIRQESAFGSAKIQAVPIGDEVLYVSPDRRKVRALKFSLEGGGWYSRDLTFAAEHVTKPGIVDLVFARDPFSTIAAVLGDGTLACCNYDRAEEVNGWWTVTPAGLTLSSAAVLNTPDGDEIWGVALIAEAPTAYRAGHIVRMPLYEDEEVGFDARTGPYTAQDAGLLVQSGTVAYAAGQLTFSVGYNAIPGSRIKVGLTTYRVISRVSSFISNVEVIEGPTDPQGPTAGWTWIDWFFSMVPPAGGWSYPYDVGSGVTLLDSATGERFQAQVSEGFAILAPKDEEATYYVGLPFTATAETLPIEGGNPAGTAQGMQSHFASITARVSDSVPPLINGARAGDGRPFSVPLDEVEPRVTADLKVQNLGVSEGGIITIEQDLPFRTEVCAIYGQVQMSKV